MTATYTKLKSGEWGIRVETTIPPEPGATITVRKKDGTTKTETIAKVVWSGNGISLCTIGSTGSSYTPKSGKSRRTSDDDRCDLCNKNKWTCGHCIGW